MKAVVMAGGEGSRLRPLTVNRPKPMVPIVNKPVMGHILDLLKQHGITEVVVTVQYLASVIQDTFGSGSQHGMKIHYSVEEVPLGTAGSVRNAREYLDDTFMVISGDALTDFNLSEIINFHKQKKSVATLTLYRVPNPLEYGVIITDEEGRIRQFLEKPSWGEVFSDTVNTGIYVLEPEVFDYFEAGKPVDFSQEVFPRLLRENQPLYGYVADGYWCDVGNISEYNRANADMLRGLVEVGPLGRQIGDGIWCEGEDVEIAPDAQLYGPMWLGEAVKIKGGAIIRGPAIIRNYTVIDTRAQVDRSIIWRNCYVGERAEIRGATVCRQCSVKSRVMIFEGAVIGDNTTIGEGAIIQPNVKIWPNKEIDAGATVSSSIIWGSQGRRVLFSRWGVTGLVNVDITPEFGAKLGSAYGAVLPRGATVTMNRDPHRTPRMIKRAMISGLPSAGVNVLDIKTLPIPVARYITRISDAVGGVHVRLSPYDNRVVDIKFFDSRGMDLDKPFERKIENTFFREDYRRVYLDEIGSISEAPYLASRYTEDFAAQIDMRLLQKQSNCTLVVDYANSSAGLVLPQVLSQFGCNIVALNAAIDEVKLSRGHAEFEDSMRHLALISQSLSANMGVRLDTGGEKVFVVDGLGREVEGWNLLGAVAALVLQQDGGGTIAVPITAPSMFEHLVEKYGGTVVRTRANVQALMAAAAREGTKLVGDGEGGIIFPKFHPAMDGLFAIAKIHELLIRAGVSLSEVVASLPSYHLVRTKVPCAWEDKGKVMRMLGQQFRERRGRQVDGVRIDMGEEWVLVLPDADRPLFHVMAEATSHAGAQALTEKYAALVNSLQR